MESFIPGFRPSGLAAARQPYRHCFAAFLFMALRFAARRCRPCPPSLRGSSQSALTWDFAGRGGFASLFLHIIFLRSLHSFLLPPAKGMRAGYEARRSL
jgi:hypothetical protein